MLRRTLILGLLALPATGLAAADISAPRLPRRVPLQGLHRHQGRALWPALAAGDALTLGSLRDETMPGGIGVYWGEFLIGHLPPAECAGLQRCLQQDVLQARIAAVDEKGRAISVLIERRDARRKA